MQGGGTSAGGESPAHASEPGGGAPTVSGRSEFDAAGNPEVPERSGEGEAQGDTRSGRKSSRD